MGRPPHFVEIDIKHCLESMEEKVEVATCRVWTSPKARSKCAQAFGWDLLRFITRRHWKCVQAICRCLFSEFSPSPCQMFDMTSKWLVSPPSRPPAPFAGLAIDIRQKTVAPRNWRCVGAMGWEEEGGAQKLPYELLRKRRTTNNEAGKAGTLSSGES